MKKFNENEQRFIYECIRIFLGSKDFPKLSKIYQSINIAILNKLILAHHIGGIFYKLYLDKVFDKINLTSASIELWKSASIKNSLLNAVYEKETLRIIDKLIENKIDYFYIKGFSTRKRCYDDDYLNSPTDIDFFIKKEDYELVKNILISDGYEIPLDYYINKIAAPISFNEFEKRESGICFVKKEEALRFIIDLQWDLINYDKTDIFHKIYNLTTFYKFEEKDIIELEGKKINVFPLELEFINMAFHYAYHHGFIGIKWLIEICLFIKKFDNKINFDFILKNADFNLKKILGITLMLAYDYNFKKDISKDLKKLFCVDKLAPFEYLFYKSMTMRPFNSKSSGMFLPYIKILLPYKMNGQFSVIKEKLKSIVRNSFKNKINKNLN